MALAAFPWDPAPRGPRHAGRVARVGAAAVRIPDPRVLPLPVRFQAKGPQIFVHEGARQALERRLAARAPGPVQLAVTDNRQRMVTRTLERGTLRVRVHMMFLGAPERIQEALVDYVLGNGRSASQLVGEFIDSNSHRIRAVGRPRGVLRTRGEVHDLAALRAQLLGTYLEGEAAEVPVTWGPRRPRPEVPRRAIRLGTYDLRQRLVRLHPVLDRPWVPRYFVAFVLYHELLHHVVPAVRVGARTDFHPPEFRRRERLFRNYERAVAWEAAHLSRLLRS